MTSEVASSDDVGVDGKPGAVLFVCNRNSIRSPMAEVIAKDVQAKIPGPMTYVDSAGIDPDEVNGFAIRVLSEWDLHLERHVAKSLDDINFDEFDLVISLAEPVRGYLEANCDLGSARHIFWDIEDPAGGQALNPALLPGFQRVRDDLRRRIEALLGGS